MSTTRTIWIAAAAASFALSGCFFTPPSRGEDGVVELAYDEGAFGCLFGCDAREPMAARSTTHLDVTNAAELPTFDVASDDPGVLEVIHTTGDASMRLESGMEGEAGLVFTDTSGERIDRYVIEVRDVHRIELDSPSIQTRYLLMVGGSDTLHLDLFDRRDRQLKGYGGVDYALTGSIGESELTLTSALADSIARAFAGSTSESARVEALALGDGQIEVTAPSGMSLTIPVEVVDESAVARVEVEDEEQAPGSGMSLAARTFASDGEEIHDPDCTWSIQPADGPIQISNDGRESVTVLSEQEGTATLTCTVGSASGSGTITYRTPPPEG